MIKLEMKNVSLGYNHKPILEDINLQVSSGELGRHLYFSVRCQGAGPTTKGPAGGRFCRRCRGVPARDGSSFVPSYLPQLSICSQEVMSLTQVGFRPWPES